MNFQKRLLSIVLILIFCAMNSLTVLAQSPQGLSDTNSFHTVAKEGFCGPSENRESIKYTVYRDGIMEFTGSGEMGYFIKSSLNIDTYNDLKEVRIGEGITSIYEGAFYEFKALNHVELPESLTEIGKGAFQYCSSLREITLPSTLEKIGSNAFQLSSLTFIELPASLKEIGESAFSQCKLTALVIPEGVQKIGNDAFAYNSSLTLLSLPSSATSIGTGIVSGCTSLTQFSVSEKNTKYTIIDNSLFTKDHTELICGNPSATGIYTVPTGTTKIAASAFSRSKVEGIILPDGITSIEGDAFSWCSNLQAIYIPQSVATFGKSDGLLGTILYGGSKWQWNAINSGNPPVLDGYLRPNAHPSDVSSMIEDYHQRMRSLYQN